MIQDENQALTDSFRVSRRTPTINGISEDKEDKGSFIRATFAAIISAIFSFERCEEVNQL